MSIFVPTGNRAMSLNTVLNSLTKQTYKNFEVLIVDYKSSDNTPAVIEKFSRKIKIKVLKQKTKGLAKAANMALKASRGRIFIRTDDDVIMSPGWLSAIQDTFTNDKKVGGVTGPTVIPKQFLKNRDLFIFEKKLARGSLFWKTLGKIYFGYFLEGKPYAVSKWYRSGAFALGSNFESARRQPYQEVSNLEACNFAVRTDLLKKAGGFSEHYGGVGEYHEADAAFKIKNMGYKLVFNPKAFLNHCPSQEGFYNDRPESYSRMINFTLFYLRYIKPDSIDKFFRFVCYLMFLNSYYIFTAIKTRQLSQLGALPGTLVGLSKYLSHRD